MTILLFVVALALSAVAAWYAIAGLVAIFAASAVPIMIMGSLLEASKLVVASWLYRNWKEIPKLFKAYFLVALMTLMLLTSMGIFGFLSKAHLDQAVPTGDVASKVALLDEKINIQKENINAARKQITQLDQIADQTIARTEDARGVERANQIRRSQQRERNRLLNEIGAAQKEIAKLNEEKAPIAKDLRKIEAEVGPIKYIAALIYGDNPDSNVLEKAVRIVTLMIVFVFDPLAVLMLVAANWQQKKEAQKPPSINDFVKQPTELIIDDEVKVKENSITTQVIEEPESESELPEIQVDSPTKDWEPELYDRKEVKKNYDHHASYPNPPKTQSFLSKIQDIFKSPSVDVKTIEVEVEDLQNKKKPDLS